MIFSTPVFFAFFVVYFGLHFAVPRRHRLWPDHRRQHGLLCLVEDRIPLDPLYADGDRLAWRTMDRSRQGSGSTLAAYRRGDRGVAAAAGDLQIYRLRLSRRLRSVFRDRPRPLEPALAARHLLCQLHAHGLPRRHLSRSLFGGPPAEDRPGLCAVLPASDRGTDPSALRAHPATRKPARRNAARLRGAVGDLHARPGQEAGLRGPARADGDRCLRPGHHEQCAGGDACDHRLCRTGLLRLLGLHGHGDWTCGHARDQAADQLPSALCRNLHQRACGAAGTSP